MTIKPTLRDLKCKTTVTTQGLVEQARLPIGDVFTVEVGGYISQEKARKVVHAFNLLSGMRIEVEDILIHCEEPIV